MLRRAWVGVLAVALLATAASAGSLRIRSWPIVYFPQEIANIPVVMDIGFWMDVITEPETLKLLPVGPRTYKGCVDLQIRSNFNMIVTCSILSTGAVPGHYSCSPEQAYLEMPSSVVTVCAQVDDPELGNRPGGQTDVHVATIVVEVMPRS
jgi:hypothetical protein